MKSEKQMPSFKNEEFYTNGAFDEGKAKEAIVALCEYHGYPVFPGFKENLWVSDYGTGKYTELGLAAYMFVNNVEDRYMQMDIFLLPEQMLPEHWHLEGEGYPAKREGWLIRHGKSYVGGIGEDNMATYSDVQIPQCHSNGSTETKHVQVATPGQFVGLAQVESKHWQFAGKEGAILTESANVHTNSAVRHADAAINSHFLGE